MHTADLMVTVGRESRQNQVPFVSKKKHHITVWRQVDAGAEFQLCHVGRPPNLLARARLKADQFAVGFGRVNVVVPQEGGRGVAQDSFGRSHRFRPEHLCCRRAGV